MEASTIAMFMSRPIDVAFASAAARAMRAPGRVSVSRVLVFAMVKRGGE